MLPTDPKALLIIGGKTEARLSRASPAFVSDLVHLSRKVTVLSLLPVQDTVKRSPHTVRLSSFPLVLLLLSSWPLDQKLANP